MKAKTDVLIDTCNCSLYRGRLLKIVLVISRSGVHRQGLGVKRDQVTLFEDKYVFHIVRERRPARVLICTVVYVYSSQLVLLFEKKQGERKHPHLYFLLCV